VRSEGNGQHLPREDLLLFEFWLVEKKRNGWACIKARVHGWSHPAREKQSPDSLPGNQWDRKSDRPGAGSKITSGGVAVGPGRSFATYPLFGSSFFHCRGGIVATITISSSPTDKTANLISNSLVVLFVDEFVLQGPPTPFQQLPTFLLNHVC